MLLGKVWALLEMAKIKSIIYLLVYNLNFLCNRNYQYFL